MTDSVPSGVSRQQRVFSGGRGAERVFVYALVLAILLAVVFAFGPSKTLWSLDAPQNWILGSAPWLLIAVAGVALVQLARSSDRRGASPTILFWGGGAFVILILTVLGMRAEGVFDFAAESFTPGNFVSTLLRSYGLIFAAVGFLISAALYVVNAGTINQKPGFIGALFVGNLPTKVAALPMVATALLVFIGATSWTVLHSFTKSKTLPKLEFVGLDQYERLWAPKNGIWWIAIENLAIFAVIIMVFQLVLGFILAALLDQKIRFENTFRTIMLYPFALSFIVTGLVWQWLLNPTFGVENIVRSLGWESFTFDPLFNPEIVIYGICIAGLWHGTGLVMCLMLAGLRGIDEDIWKAARVDGIPMWKTYIRIVIPMMRPVFITTIVLVSSGILRVFDLVVAQTSGGPGTASQMPAMYVYKYMFQGQNLGQGFAASTMMLLAVLVILIPWAYLEFGGRKQNG